MPKLKKIILFNLFILLLIYIGANIFMFNFALKKKEYKNDEESSYAYLFEHDYLKQWIDSLNEVSALCDTTIVASDGARLHALYIKSPIPTPNTALIIHGYTDNAIRMLMIGHLYNKELEYNILIPDLRAHGKSDGGYIQMGWKDRLDMLEWIEVGKHIYGDSINIALHGISMGAATAMMMVGENALPENVKCVVEDCGYTSVWDEFSHQLKEDFGLPSFPLLNTTSMLCDALEGWNFKEASALEQIKKTQMPILFIHGEADTYVPFEMAKELYNAKSGEKELWSIPEVTHAKAYWKHTEKYVERTRRFVNKHISN